LLISFVSAAPSRWPRSWISRSTIQSSATTPAAQRSGRAGDFTSVDVGSLFGELLEVQLSEISRILNSEFQIPNFDLVEAGAGNGRLSADILRAAKAHHPDFYESIHLHLVEASTAARAAQAATLGDVPSGWHPPVRRCRIPSKASGSPTSCSTRCRSTRS
jgi:SAM-dependent MidA family methyltransferase